MTRGCFVVGTDTEVGKTYQAAALAALGVARGFKIGVYKPAASGAASDSQSDAQRLRSAARLSCPLTRICPQQFNAPVAPPVAARAEGRLVDQQLLLDGARAWEDDCDFLIIEGVGGVLSPISDRWTFLDFASSLGWDLPFVIVAANRLGVVNHTLLTIEAIRHRKFSVAAIMLNRLPQSNPAKDSSLGSNLALLQQFADEVLITTSIEQVADRLIS